MTAALRTTAEDRSATQARLHPVRCITTVRLTGTGYGSSRYGSGSGIYSRPSSGYPSRTGVRICVAPTCTARPYLPTSPLSGGYRSGQAGRTYGYAGPSLAQSRPGIGNEHVAGGFRLSGSSHESNPFVYGGSYKAPRSSSFGGGHSRPGAAAVTLAASGEAATKLPAVAATSEAVGGTLAAAPAVATTNATDSSISQGGFELVIDRHSLKSSTVSNGVADHGRKRLIVNFVGCPGTTSTCM